jgi:hypothetical protein
VSASTHRAAGAAGAAGLTGDGRPGSQGGSSLVVVLIMIVIIVLFGTAFVIRATGDLQSSRDVTNINAARAQAMAGLSDALFRLDQQGSASAGFCVGDAPQCTVPAVPGAPGAQYVARLVSGNTFTILSEGTVHGTSYAIEATVAADPVLPIGVFAGSNVTFNGSGSNVTIEQTNSVGAQTGGADVGSDGTITCHGGGSDGQNQVTYDGGNSNCSSWLNEANDYTPQQPVSTCPAPASTVPPPTPCMPSDPQPCPSGGSFNGSSSPYVLEPGVYECTGSITFSGTVNVDYGSSNNGGQVQIFLFPNSNGQSAIEMAGATVNQYDNTPNTQGCDGQGSFECGNPADLQVYAAGSGAVDVGSGSNAALFDGMLYAPGMSMTVRGGQLLWIGQFILNQVIVNGNPNFSVHYDTRVSSVAQLVWQVENFTAIAPQSFSLSLS